MSGKDPRLHSGYFTSASGSNNYSHSNSTNSWNNWNTSSSKSGRRTPPMHGKSSGRHTPPVHGKVRIGPHTPPLPPPPSPGRDSPPMIKGRSPGRRSPSPAHGKNLGSGGYPPALHGKMSGSTYPPSLFGTNSGYPPPLHGGQDLGYPSPMLGKSLGGGDGGGGYSSSLFGKNTGAYPPSLLGKSLGAYNSNLPKSSKSINMSKSLSLSKPFLNLLNSSSASLPQSSLTLSKSSTSLFKSSPASLSKPPNMANPPPSMSKPPPSMSKLPPSMSKPLPSMAKPPPSMSKSLPNMSNPPPNMSKPPPSMSKPLPSMLKPPPSMPKPATFFSKNMPDMQKPPPPLTPPPRTPPPPTSPPPSPNFNKHPATSLKPSPSSIISKSPSQSKPISSNEGKSNIPNQSKPNPLTNQSKPNFPNQSNHRDGNKDDRDRNMPFQNNHNYYNGSYLNGPPPLPFRGRGQMRYGGMFYRKRPMMNPGPNHNHHQYMETINLDNWHPRNHYNKRPRMDSSENEPIMKTSKKKKKPLSQNMPTKKDWTIADAELALKTEKENNKKSKIALIIKFPDKELNKDTVGKFHSAIENVHFQQPCTPRFCFVTLKDTTDPEEVISALNKQQFGDGFLTVEYKKDKEEDQRVVAGDIDPLTLYVGNLAQEITKDDMVNLFPKNRRIDIGYAKKMKFTRYAFVGFRTAEESLEAFKNACNKQLYNKSLIVRFRRLHGTVGMPGESKPQNPPRSRDVVPPTKPTTSEPIPSTSTQSESVVEPAKKVYPNITVGEIGKIAPLSTIPVVDAIREGIAEIGIDLLSTVPSTDHSTDQSADQAAVKQEDMDLDTYYKQAAIKMESQPEPKNESESEYSFRAPSEGNPIKQEIKSSDDDLDDSDIQEDDDDDLEYDDDEVVNDNRPLSPPAPPPLAIRENGTNFRIKDEPEYSDDDYLGSRSGSDYVGSVGVGIDSAEDGYFEHEDGYYCEDYYHPAPGDGDADIAGFSESNFSDIYYNLRDHQERLEPLRKDCKLPK